MNRRDFIKSLCGVASVFIGVNVLPEMVEGIPAYVTTYDLDLQMTAIMKKHRKEICNAIFQKNTFLEYLARRQK